MLRTYAQELKDAFLPYVEDVARVLVPLIRFQYMDDVRSGAMAAMPELLNCTIRASALCVQGADMHLVTQLKDFMFQPIVEQLKTEPDTETLAVRGIAHRIRNRNATHSRVDGPETFLIFRCAVLSLCLISMVPCRDFSIRGTS